MINRWLRPTSYNSIILLLAMGVFAALFGWISYNLIHLGMENYRFLRQFGTLAVMEGGLGQLVEIILYGYLSLAFYLGFKICEVELVHRWRTPAPHGSCPPDQTK